MLRRGANRGGMAAQTSRPALEVPVASELLEGPPGFPLLFPELSKEDRKMAMMYISHADETERKARILRVQQGIEESKTESSIRLTRITKELDKGKGHVFSYNDHNTDKVLCVKGPSRTKPALVLTENEEGEGEAESSASQFSFCSEPVILTGFRLGPSTEGRVSRSQGMSKAPRRRPPSWKRKPHGKTIVSESGSVPRSPTKEPSAKRNKNKSVSSCVRQSFPWILWHVWKAKNMFCYERIATEPSVVIRRAMEDAVVWLNLHDAIPRSEGANVTTGVGSTVWEKRPTSYVKCNVGSSWDENLKIGGAS
ncbi:hypothetical protein F2Q68_00011199 [Brassica cretica]|uniref:Uncharacterized protein n=1 Tax=Brassica cretica TaxID=69181 RepID=A0A8S9KPU4_BRACR|nr:hypothetical protein F2Q68_00011199 [Brassica cretica]